jgi:hypothetical protein
MIKHATTTQRHAMQCNAVYVQNSLIQDGGYFHRKGKGKSKGSEMAKGGKS